MRVLTWRADWPLKFASGRIGVTAAQASLLPHLGCGVLIGQSVCKLQACVRETIDCTRSRSEQLHTCMDKRQFALNSFVTLLLDPNVEVTTKEEVVGDYKCPQWWYDSEWDIRVDFSCRCKWFTSALAAVWYAVVWTQEFTPSDEKGWFKPGAAVGFDRLWFATSNNPVLRERLL